MVISTNTGISGIAALNAIAAQLRYGTEPGKSITDPALDRLSSALHARANRNGNRPSNLDLAILVRQALRFQDLRSQGISPLRLWVPSGDGWPSPEIWEQVGIVARKEEGGFTVWAQPWMPAWLSSTSPDGVDAASAGENHMRQSDSVPGDPFLSRIPGHETYLTRGQRFAVRAALNTPAGATLLICLPTGDGKSLVFQLISLIGFGSADGLPGVTLVVTPTVALAMDQQRSSDKLGLFQHKLAYIGGMSSEERNHMTDRIKRGTQGLCIASPEAVCGPLLEALSIAATAGLLRAIVIDEAHLVDTWGANFRASFQVLSGVRADLLSTAPEAKKPRTILLSATLTNATVETLRTLFPGDSINGSEFGLVSAAQLRPEIDYWAAKPSTSDERTRRVTEALLYMPRPAILYVTEVKHAQEWHRTLRLMGFRRLGMITGKTPNDERMRVLRDWDQGGLDIVVGTSAFGLGIDNPHVRTVIHACVPETLDRYYQEVGRGGRDGFSSASIIVPTEEKRRNARDDYRTARSLNKRRLLTVETAHRRWTAMFKHKSTTFVRDQIFKLCVDGSPGFDTKFIDMVGETNTEWNVRTLTLMANAGMLKLLGPRSTSSTPNDSGYPGDLDAAEIEDVKRFEQFQTIEINETRHLDIASWQELVEPHRERMEAASHANLRRMFRFIDGVECSAETLAPIYRLDWPSSRGDETTIVGVATACGGCLDCRSHDRRRETLPAQNAWYPWRHIVPIRPPISEFVDSGNRLVVFYSGESNVRTIRRWTDALALLASYGVQKVIALPGAPIHPGAIQVKVPNIPLFAADSLPPRDFLPPGPTMIILPPDWQVTETLIRRRKVNDEHFLFVHRDAMYPNMPNMLLRDRFEGAQFANLDLFIERANS